MSKAIRIHETGGPEVLHWEDVAVGDPGPGEVRLRQTAIGLNFIDVYFRTGLYPAPSFPCTLGMEGAAVIEAIGEGVTEFAPGDRVAYADNPLGAYAEIRLMPAHRLVKLPATIDDRQAAAMMLKGMTAEYLLRRTYKLRAGETILVHAAAGGVGLILCQWAKHLGATVIGTVGSADKAALAKAHGCDHPILYRDEDFVARVAEITDGKGVAVAYDSIGKDTFYDSMKALARFGTMASFGQSSGDVGAVDMGSMRAKALFLTRPGLMVYNAERADLIACTEALFDVVASGAVKIEINQTYALADAAQAHRDLEARKTTGSTVLLV
ncbi:MAG: quinone oxidoreductase family protein [Alphaproteobacteria bacterium]